MTEDTIHPKNQEIIVPGRTNFTISQETVKQAAESDTMISRRTKYVIIIKLIVASVCVVWIILFGPGAK